MRLDIRLKFKRKEREVYEFKVDILITSALGLFDLLFDLQMIWSLTHFYTVMLR